MQVYLHLCVPPRAAMLGCFWGCIRYFLNMTPPVSQCVPKRMANCRTQISCPIIGNQPIPPYNAKCMPKHVQNSFHIGDFSDRKRITNGPEQDISGLPSVHVLCMSGASSSTSPVRSLARFTLLASTGSGTKQCGCHSSSSFTLAATLPAVLRGPGVDATGTSPPLPAKFTHH